MNTNLIPLAKLDDWQLKHDRQDIRGWTLRDGRGQQLGTVSDLLVDREHERVSAVTLSDGSTVPIERLSICGDHLELKDGAGDRQGMSGVVQEARIPIVEEEIRVGKREVETGGVRVRSHVVEEPVHEEVRLRDEQVEIERRPVEDGRFKPEFAPNLMRDREVEMREVDEEAVVQKQAVVKEELILRKSAHERVEDIDTTVRRTEVDVEEVEGRR